MNLELPSIPDLGNLSAGEFLRELCTDVSIKCPSQEVKPGALNAISQGNWFDEFRRGNLTLDSAEGLALSRLVARMAAASTNAPAGGWGTVYFFTSAWVRHLVSPEGTRQRFFLQEYVARDNFLYDQGTLRPKKWCGNCCWRKAYPWLRHPERLTITELELVLAIFRPVSACSGGRPRLVGWLERYPHLLWQVHRFLLSRYCFQLLPAFREALKAGRWKADAAPRANKVTGNETVGAGSCEGAPSVQSNAPLGAHEGQTASQRTLNAPPFRAGEFLRFYPRIGGLVAIGFLGLLQIEVAQGLFFETGWVPPLLAGTGAVTILFFLNYMDVYKQNRGVMSDRLHGVIRAVSLLVRFLAWGAIMTALYLVCVRLLFGVPAWEGLTRALFDRGIWDVAPRVFAMATSSCLIGALLQWFFEDTAATEPI